MRRHQPSDALTLSIAEATELGTRALEQLGYEPEAARITCDHLVDAACCGYPFAGLPRILEIADNPRVKEPRQPIRVVRETPVSMLIDGGNQIGYYAVYKAACMAAEKAKKSGIAVVGLHNCALSGRNSYYLDIIARDNLVGMMFSGAGTVVAPEGGMRARLGTNPMAFTLPSADGPYTFDMGTAAIMRGELALRSRLGEDLPEGVAIDEQGMLTRDPLAALKGAILPFGGADRHKGFGLSLTIQALGLLAGCALPHGNVSDYGHLFVVFDPELLLPAEDYKRDLSRLIKLIKDTPRRPGVDEIRIPSERSRRERARTHKEGIPIDRKVYDALKLMGAGGHAA